MCIQVLTRQLHIEDFQKKIIFKLKIFLLTINIKELLTVKGQLTPNQVLGSSHPKFGQLAPYNYQQIHVLTHNVGIKKFSLRKKVKCKTKVL